MATFSGSMARKGRALALAASSTMAAVTLPAVPAMAGEFSQKECRGISGIAGAVVRRVGKDNLSLEFRQSFVDWMGAEFRCDGPKEIALVTDEDAATYRTIRSELLQLPKSIDLKKAGLKPVERSSAASAPSVPQKRSDAGPGPVVN